MARNLLLRKRVLKSLKRESASNVARLANSLGVHRSSVSRLLYQLKSLGLVKKGKVWELTDLGLQETDKIILPDKDITSLVSIYGYDDRGVVTITKCACGQTFEPWAFTIDISKDYLVECPCCHRRMYCQIEVRVYDAEGYE